MPLRKNLIILNLMLAVFAKGQNKEINTIPFADTAVKLNLKCPSSYLLKNNEPLIIINGARFPYNSLDSHFFNVSEIENIKVFNPKNDTARQYGRAAKNGVIILNTKRPIDWQSSSEIIRKYDKNPFHSYKTTLIIIDNNKVDPNRKYYFAEGIIKTIKFENNANEFYLHRFYKRIICITTTLKNLPLR